MAFTDEHSWWQQNRERLQSLFPYVRELACLVALSGPDADIKNLDARSGNPVYLVTLECDYDALAQSLHALVQDIQQYLHPAELKPFITQLLQDHANYAPHRAWHADVQEALTTGGAGAWLRVFRSIQDRPARSAIERLIATLRQRVNAQAASELEGITILNGSFYLKVHDNNELKQLQRYFHDQHRTSGLRIAPLVALAHYQPADKPLGVALYEPAQGRVTNVDSLAKLLSEAQDRTNDHDIIINNLDGIARGLRSWWQGWKDRPGTKHTEHTDTPTGFDALRNTLGLDRVVPGQGRATVLERLQQLLPDAFQDIGRNPHMLIHAETTSRRFYNPVAYLYDQDLWHTVSISVPLGESHGDLHSGNIMTQRDQGSHPDVIDRGNYDRPRPTFFDFAYLELDIVLRCLQPRLADKIDPLISDVETMLDASNLVLAGDVQLNIDHRLLKWLRPLRKQVAEMLQQDDAMAPAWWLAVVAAGLNFARKEKATHQQRLLALIYAGQALSILAGLSFGGVSIFKPQPNPNPIRLNWKGELTVAEGVKRVSDALRDQKRAVFLFGRKLARAVAGNGAEVGAEFRERLRWFGYANPPREPNRVMREYRELASDLNLREAIRHKFSDAQGEQGLAPLVGKLRAILAASQASMATFGWLEAADLGLPQSQVAPLSDALQAEAARLFLLCGDLGNDQHPSVCLPSELESGVDQPLAAYHQAMMSQWRDHLRAAHMLILVECEPEDLNLFAERETTGQNQRTSRFLEHLRRDQPALDILQVRAPGSREGVETSQVGGLTIPVEREAFFNQLAQSLLTSVRQPTQPAPVATTSAPAFLDLHHVANQAKLAAISASDTGFWVFQGAFGAGVSRTLAHLFDLIQNTFSDGRGRGHQGQAVFLNLEGRERPASANPLALLHLLFDRFGLDVPAVNDWPKQVPAPNWVGWKLLTAIGGRHAPCALLIDGLNAASETAMDWFNNSFRGQLRRDHHLKLVIGWRGDLPPTLALRQGDTLITLDALRKKEVAAVLSSYQAPGSRWKSSLVQKQAALYLEVGGHRMLGVSQVFGEHRRASFSDFGQFLNPKSVEREQVEDLLWKDVKRHLDETTRAHDRTKQQGPGYRSIADVLIDNYSRLLLLRTFHRGLWGYLVDKADLDCPWIGPLDQAADSGRSPCEVLDAKQKQLLRWEDMGPLLHDAGLYAGSGVVTGWLNVDPFLHSIILRYARFLSKMGSAGAYDPFQPIALALDFAMDLLRGWKTGGGPSSIKKEYLVALADAIYYSYLLLDTAGGTSPPVTASSAIRQQASLLYAPGGIIATRYEALRQVSDLNNKVEAEFRRQPHAPDSFLARFNIHLAGAATQ